MTQPAPGAMQLEIPPGPRSRAALVRIEGTGPAEAAVAARLLLTETRGMLDGLAVAHVLLAGPQPLAALAAETLSTPEAATAIALASTAAELVADVRLSVAEAIALRCHHLGVRKVFAYPGTSELALCHAFAALGNGRLVNARGDREAVFMAGGGGLAARRPEGVAVVHGARGLTNAAGAVADLRRNEVPTLVIVGLPSTRSAQFLPPHTEDDLLETVGAFAKAQLELRWPARTKDRGDVDAVAVVDQAMAIAEALPRGPVLVGVAQDILEARVAPAANLARPWQPLPKPTPSRRVLRRAGSLLGSARSPVILIDDYLLQHAGAGATLAAFAEALAAPVFQLRYRRGPMLFPQLTAATTPLFAGLYDPKVDSHRKLMAAADLLITVEDRNTNRRVVGDLPACPKIAITSNPDKTRRNAYLGAGDVILDGDPLTVLVHLTGKLATAPTPPANQPNPTTTTQPRGAGQVPRPQTPRERLQATLAELVRGCLELTDARYVIDDSQIAGGLLAAVYEHAFGDVALIGDHGGFVGAGIALAAGLAVTQSQPVLCLVGDQGFTNGAGGLVAASQETAPVLYIVCNNHESVSLRTQAAELSVSEPGSDLDRLLRNAPEYSYCAAASAAGIPNTLIEIDPIEVDPNTPGVRSVELGRALAAIEALWSVRRPALVELQLPASGPAWEGVWATHGLDDQPPAATGTPGPPGRFDIAALGKLTVTVAGP